MYDDSDDTDDTDEDDDNEGDIENGDEKIELGELIRPGQTALKIGSSSLRASRISLSSMCLT